MHSPWISSGAFVVDRPPRVLHRAGCSTGAVLVGVACVCLTMMARCGVSSAAEVDAPLTETLAPGLALEQNASPFFTAIGSATSQGVSVLKADQARSIFGVTGAGVKLGVISDSFNGSGSTPTLATQISLGNLPGAGNPNGYTTGVTVVKDDTGTDEGRAMLEIVHDVAPGAQLFFHSAFNNTQTPGYTSFATAAPDQTIADAINGLASQAGMRIIVDDVGILTASRFQDGAAAQAANAAYGKGIAYFSAAGNSATNATRVTTSAGVNGTVNWGSDDLLLLRLNAGSTGRVVLQWGEPYTSVSGSAATSNFVVNVMTPNGAASYGSVDNQWASEDPYEFFSFTNSGTAAVDFAVRATRLSGTAPVVMQLSTFGSGISITDGDKTNAPTVYGQAAASGAVAVAASYWGTPTSVESFSSRGPTQILFDASGNPVNDIRSTPLLTAPDGGTTTTAGFTSFYGTSAAAPHAAAVAALVMERFDQKGISSSTQDVYQVLYDSAVDIGTAGFDSSSGYGRIDALAAVSAGRIWDGNGSTAGVSGTGSWSQAKWTLEAAGDKPTGKFIRGQQAIFGSGTAAQSSYAVTVDGNYDVAGLKFTRDTVSLASGSGSLRLTSPTVDVASGLTATVAATLIGTNGLQKTGAGTLALTGSTGYTGGTTVSAGRLVANGYLAASGTVAVAAGGMLAGSGTVGAVTLAANATIAPGNSPGTLTTGDVLFGAGGNYNWQLTSATGSAGSQWDFISSSGSLTVAATTGNPFAINLWTLSGTGPDVSGPAANFNQLSNYTWKIGTFAGGITGFASNLFNLVTGSANGTDGFANAFLGTFSITTIGNDLDIVYTAPTAQTAQTFGYVGGAGSFSAGGNWAGGVPPTGYGTIVFTGTGGTATNDLVSLVNGLTFSGSATGGYVVAGNALSPGAGGVVNNSAFAQTVQAGLTLTTTATLAANAGSLTLAGGLDNGGFAVTVTGTAGTTIATLAGAGGLVKNGGGTLTLSGSGSFSGGTTINAGRVVTGASAALGSGTAGLVINGGVIDTGVVDVSVGAISGSSGALITTGTLAGTRTLTTAVASGTSTFAGSLADAGAGRLGLAKSGSGTLLLSGSNSATGGITLNAGTILAGGPSALGGTATPLVLNGGTLNTGTFSLSVGGLSGSAGGLITTATTAGTRTLTTTVANASSSVFDGTILNSGSGVMALTKAGGGTLVISGSNSYTGTTTIAAGTLAVGSGGTGGRLGSGAILNNAALSFNRSDAYGGAVSNVITGSGSVTLVGGTLTLTGSNAFTGGTTIQAGTLLLGNALAIGGTSNALAINGGTLNVQTFSPSIGPLSGSSGVITTVNTAGTRTLTTTVSSGTSIFAGTIQNSGSGVMALTKQGGGTLVLSASNAYSGTTSIAGGVLVAGDAAALGVGGVSITSGTLDTGSVDLAVGAIAGSGGAVITTAATPGTRTLATTVTSPATYAGTLRDNGSGRLALSKSGTGTLTLSGSNSHSGGTTITAGTLLAGGSFALGGTASPVALNGGTLNTGTFSLSVGRLSGSAGAVITTATTAGTRTFTTNVASGTSVFAGTLANSGSGVLALTKTGGGTLVLTGSNDATGLTTISAGTLQIGAGGTAGSIGGDFAMASGATVVFNRSDDITLTGWGGAAGTFVKDGAGTLTLAGNLFLSYDGMGPSPSVTVAQGTLQVGDGGTALGLASYIPVTNNATVAFNSSTTSGFSAPISGSGRVVKLGSGTLTLSGSNSYSGGTTLSAGTLLTGGAFALGGTASPVALNGGTLNTGTFSLSVGPLSGSAGAVITTATTAGTRTFTTNVSSGTSVFAGTLANSGSGVLALTKTGGGTLVLTGSNGATGLTSISAGTLQIGAGGTDGRLGSSVVTNNGTLVFNRSDAYGGTVANVITGSGGITLAGGTLTLTAASPFSGATAINGGTLKVNGSLASSAVSVNASGLLAGSGTVGTVTVNSGGTLTPGNSPGTLTTGDVIFNGGGSYNWQVMSATGSAGAQWDFINSSGSLTVNATTGSPFAINLWTLSGTGSNTSGPAANFNQYANGSWTIGTFAGGISGFAANLFNLVTGSANGSGGFANPFVGTFSIATVGNDLDIVYTAPALPSYDYVGGTGVFSDAANWSLGGAPTGTPTITFSGSGGTATNDLLAAVTGLSFTGSATGGYVVAGSSLSVGPGGVTNDSSFAQSIQAPLAFTATGTVAANGGSLAVAGGLDTGGFGVTVAGAADTTIASLTGAGGLVKVGSGALALTGSNAYTDGTTLTAGTILAGDPLALGGTANALAVNGGTLNTLTFDLSVGSLSGSAGGVITTATDAGTRTFTTGAAAGSTVFSGAIQDNGAGVLAFTKTGAGALTLSGSNAYSGGTTITGGTLTMGNASALGTPANALAVNGGTLNTGTFSLSVGVLSGSAGGLVTTATTAGTRTLSATVDSGTSTFAGALRDNGAGKLALSKSGSGTLLLTGSNAATGGAVLNAGTLRVGNAFALGGTANALAMNGGTLDTGTFSLSVGALSGSASAVITTATTAGTRTLSTTVASGSSVFAGSLQNSGSGVLALTKTGGGTLVLSGSSLFTGLTTISAGTLQVGDGSSGGRLGTGAVVNNGSLVFNRADAYGGPVGTSISGSGSLTLARGTLTLSSSTSFTGDTRLASGTLALAHTRGLAGSTLDMNAADSGVVAFSGTGSQTYFLGGLEGSRGVDNAGNTLSIGGNNQSTIYSGTLAGTGGLVKTGFGTFTLTGSNAFSGGTTISGGTLQIGAGGTTGALGAGSLTNNAVLAFSRSDNYGGAFTTAISGSGSVRVQSGSLALSASNSYTGGTVVTGATLQVGSGGTTGSLGTGAITNNGTLVFNRSDAYGGPLTNSISGTGSVSLTRGSLTLTGSSSSSGLTTIAGGTLTIGNGGTAGRIGSGTIANNAALVFNRNDGYGGAVANVISGSGSLTVAGGTLALSAANTFTGTTRVAAGVLSLANTQALAQSTLDLNAADAGLVTLSAGTSPMNYTLGGLSGVRNLSLGGNTLTIGGNNGSTTYLGTISGSGVFVKTGSGTLTLAGTSGYAGTTYVSAGRLVGTTLSLTGTIMSSWGSTVEFAQQTSGTFAGNLNRFADFPGTTIKSGSGTLTITGTVGGNTTVSGGRLVATTANLTYGTVTNNATLEFNQGTSGTFVGMLTGSGSLLKSGSGAVTLNYGSFTGTTTVASGRLIAPAATIRGPINDNAAFEFAQSVNGEYASVISGSGSITKSGVGTLVLSGSSLATGMTTVAGGILATGGAERLADSSTVSIASGASLRLGGNETIGSLLGSGSVNLQAFQLTIAGSGSSFYSGSIFGSGGLTKAGSGLLTLSGSNGFLGATNLNMGTLVLSNSAALSPYTTLSITAGSTLVLNQDVRVFAYTNAGGTISGSGRLLTSATAATGGTLTSLANVSGTDGYAVGLLKTSTATLVVSGSTSFTGGVVVEQGTVKLDSGGSFAASNVVDIRSGAALDLNGQSQTVAALTGSGSVALGGATLTVDASTSTTFAGAIAGGTLVKTGSSALNLTGSAAIATASVTSGLMSVNGTLSGTVAVAPGGTLGGAGTIVGDVLVSGTHAPGNSPDLSTIVGNLTYGSGATVIWEIAGNTATQGPAGSRAFDQIVVNGDLAFSGSTSLVLSFYDQDPNSSWTSAVDWTDGFWGANHSWKLWQVSGATSGFANLALQTESWLDSTGTAFGTLLPDSSFALALSGNDVTLIYTVPEPATLGLTGCGIACVILRWRCRRRRDDERHHRPSTARPPRSAIGSGTTLTSIPAK